MKRVFYENELVAGYGSLFIYVQASIYYCDDRQVMCVECNPTDKYDEARFDELPAANKWIEFVDTEGNAIRRGIEIINGYRELVRNSCK